MAFFNIHFIGKGFPHAILPLEVILFHALIVITLPALADTNGTHLCQVGVDVASDEVVVLVRLVPQTKHDVLEAIEFVLSVGELEGLILEVLQQGDGVVGRFALAVCREHEDDSAVLGDLVEVLEVVVLRVAYE